MTANIHFMHLHFMSKYCDGIFLWILLYILIQNLKILTRRFKAKTNTHSSHEVLIGITTQKERSEKPLPVRKHFFLNLV